MNFNFGEVLTRAWEILKKHKVLWIYGILAGFARGGCGGNGGGGGGSGGGTGNNPFQGDQFEQIGRWFSEHIWIIVLIGVVIILVFFALYLLGIVGKIALIKGTYKAEQGVESMSFAELWSESTPYLWRVFGLSFLIGLVFLVIFIPLILFGVFTAGVGFLCILPLLCILVPVAWVVQVILLQADAAIALEDLGMFDGFRRGWEIFKVNWGPLVVMSLILGIGGAIAGFILAIPVIIAVLPIIFGASTNSTTLLIIGALCCVIYVPVLLFLNGLLTAYIQSAWTLTYMRLTTKPQENPPVIVEGNAQ